MAGTLTDRDLLTEMQLHLLEPSTDPAVWPSGLWEASEAIAALNQAQNTVLRQSLCQFTRAQLVTLAQTLRHPLPQDWIATQRVSFETADHAQVKEVPRGDLLQADLMYPDWMTEKTVGPPALWMDVDTDTTTIQVAPATLNAGWLWLLYVATGQSFDGHGVADAGVPITTPDDLSMLTKWEALGILLSKTGRAHDAERAAYCFARAALGIEALRVALAQWALV